MQCAKMETQTIINTSVIIILIVMFSSISSADTTITTKDKLNAYAESIIKEQVNYKAFAVKDYAISKDKSSLMKINVDIDGKSFTWYTTKSNFDKITK